MKKRIEFKDKYIFHVHSFRCGHAAMVEDEEYVKRAIELGAKQIIFTDHVPFPGDEFMYRMPYSQLEEYLSTLTTLKEKYKDEIEINIGLEAEYFPSFHDYLEELSNRDEIEILINGQHFFEDENGVFSKDLTSEEKNKLESEKCMRNMYQAIESELFQVIAHPDRCYKREKEWSKELETYSKELIDLANKHDIILEKNIQSMIRKYNYWDEFWELVPEATKIVIGSDAHHLDEMHVIDKDAVDFDISKLEK